MTNPNKELWSRVCVTDPKAVKEITGKQYRGNSPKPYWIVERLTEEFGPCGIGWGFTIASERMERLSQDDVLHVAVVDFWYVLDGKTGHIQQVGQTKATYMSSKDKLVVDEDAPKKSVTDALVKCASYIGFAGDIFAGRWDDSKYVAEANREWRAKEDAEQAASRAEHRAHWLADQQAAIEAAATVGEMKGVLGQAILIAQSEGDDEAVGILQAAAATKIAKAKKATKEAA